MSRSYSESKLQPARPGLWSAIRAAFAGAEHDFTSGSLPRAIVILAVPMVLEMLMQSVFGVVDVYFVSRHGSDAVAAVGMTDSLLILVLAVALGLSMATTAMVARRIGEKDPAGAARAAFQALALGTVVSVPISLVGVFFAPELLRLMGASPGVVEVGWSYCAILFGTNAVIVYLTLINAIFRGAGDAVLAMRALWLANGLNIVLDPLLIFGIGPFPELGVGGAAAATSIGRGVGIAYQLYVLLGRRGRIRLDARAVGIDPGVMRRLLRVAAPGMVQFIVGTASWMALFRIMATFGSDAVAGYTIALRVLVFALLPSWGMGNAAATLVGQNLGARRPDRAERAVWITSFTNMAFLGATALFVIFNAEALVRLFTDAPAVVAYGVDCLRIVSYTYVLFAFGQVTTQAFNGAGDTATPTWINLVCYWMLQIPLAYVLSIPLAMGARGVFTAIAIAQAVLALTATYLFRRGRWKQKAI